MNKQYRPLLETQTGQPNTTRLTSRSTRRWKIEGEEIEFVATAFEAAARRTLRVSARPAGRAEHGLA